MAQALLEVAAWSKPDLPHGACQRALIDRFRPAGPPASRLSVGGHEILALAHFLSAAGAGLPVTDPLSGLVRVQARPAELWRQG